MSVPRCPDELLRSSLPHWVKVVWLAVRSVQGDNAAAWANANHYAEVCGMDPRNVRKALGQLEAEGWVVRDGRNTSCTVPGTGYALDDGCDRIPCTPKRIPCTPKRIPCTRPSESVQESVQESERGGSPAIPARRPAGPYENRPQREPAYEPPHRRGAPPATLADVLAAAPLVSLGPIEAEAFFLRYADAAGERCHPPLASLAVSLKSWKNRTARFGDADAETRRRADRADGGGDGAPVLRVAPQYRLKTLDDGPTTFGP